MAALSEADDREAQALACTTHASAFNRSFQTLQDVRDHNRYFLSRGNSNIFAFLFLGVPGAFLAATARRPLLPRSRVCEDGVSA